MPDVMFLQSESCDCPQCSAKLPDTCIRSEFAADAAPYKTTRVYCPHCDAGWKVDRARIAGVWLNDGNIERIDDAAELKKLRGEVEALHGVIQVPAIKTRNRVMRRQSQRALAAL